MADIPIRVDNGLNTSGDPLSLAPGFLTKCEGMIYMPDDPSRPFKHPGHTVAAALPAAASTANTKGLAFFQYEGAADQFILYANSQFYEVDAAVSGIGAGDWADVADQASTAFVRSGSILKAIPDGDNGWIMWTGNDEERPIIREEGGHSWLLGLNRSPRPTLTASTTDPSASIVRPVSSTRINTEVTINGVTVTPAFEWFDDANAYDDDLDTVCSFFVTGTASPPSYASEEYNFTEGGNIPANQELLIVDALLHGAVSANIYVEISYDGGTTYTTAHTFTVVAPETFQSVSIPLTGGTLWTDFKVRMSGHVSGYGFMWSRFSEIFTQTAAAGGPATIDEGTYYYAVTEVFEVTGGNRPRYIEGAPSDTAKFVAAGTELGIILTFDANQSPANTAADGVKDDPTNNLKHYYKIYRTTKSGIWPDLGYIASVPITATTFTDTFQTSGETLGSPGINVVYEKDIPVEAAGVPPPFRDAVYFRGVVIFIPANDPFRIGWTMPGNPHYHPFPSHDLKLIPSNRNDELKGITAIGDSVLVFSRTMVHRIRELQIVDRANYDAQTFEIDPVSPNEGLAGGALSHTLAYSQKGHAVAIWVSDNGIWMTDGSLVSEGGMGIVKLSVFMDWHREVQVTSLSTSKLFYDSTLQLITFEYTDRDGNAQVRYFHTSPHHWVNTGQDQAVPKTTGDHTQFAATQRASGEISNKIRHFALDNSNLKIYNERDGTDLAGSDIVSHVETGKNYLAGPDKEFQIYDGVLRHSDWGPSESCDLEIHVEDDASGIIQALHLRGLRLNGARDTSFWVNRSGQSARLIFRHVGKTTSDGSLTKAFGPIMLSAESLGDVEP